MLNASEASCFSSLTAPASRLFSSGKAAVAFAQVSSIACSATWNSVVAPERMLENRSDMDWLLGCAAGFDGRPRARPEERSARRCGRLGRGEQLLEQRQLRRR